MQFDDNFPHRVASCRARLGLTQSELASKIGVVQRMVAAYEIGESKPRMKVLIKLAEALNVSEEWLAAGDGQEPDIRRSPSSAPARQIPIISSENVSAWLYDTGEKKNLIEKLHTTSLPLSNLGFALVIDDPAMASSDQFGYGFPRKCLVFFDPCMDAEDQDFVLVLTLDGKTMFRQLFAGYSGTILQPIDNRYPPENLTSYEDEEGNTPMLIPAISYEVQLPSAERLQDSALG
ncbi:XRE family transcriptional regulator [Buttiauxella sp. 3AFRM03]|uniref:XRE family transcriptional regulator n=1 Tax=Buttiauxella sp. 3AFRM03 TaxID=2479367 RepID=UPI000EF792D1|nr:XRE family transcriptional regulator [Buttiauxella sp. 3AFRM03]AYN25779.1 XRE family transcriptional regulator [Buttiauxella sp. 3AFRM03]